MIKIISHVLVLPIRLYQLLLSPVLSGLFGMRCRYEPSCSHYVADAIYEWGPIKGLWLGIKRVASCHPYGGFGHDPVPPNPNKKK